MKTAGYQTPASFFFLLNFSSLSENAASPNMVQAGKTQATSQSSGQEFSRSRRVGTVIVWIPDSDAGWNPDFAFFFLGCVILAFQKLLSAEEKVGGYGRPPSGDI